VCGRVHLLSFSSIPTALPHAVCDPSSLKLAFPPFCPLRRFIVLRFCVVAHLGGGRGKAGWVVSGGPGSRGSCPGSSRFACTFEFFVRGIIREHVTPSTHGPGTNQAAPPHLSTLPLVLLRSMCVAHAGRGPLGAKQRPGPRPSHSWACCCTVAYPTTTPSLPHA
jgi:hypothetical protein